MKRYYIDELKPQTECKICGWVEKIREQKTMIFVVVRDVSGAVQVSIEREKQPEIASEIKKLTRHSFVCFYGQAVTSEYVKLGGIEFIPTKLEIQSIADELPIDNSSSQDLRLDYRWIDLRDEKKILIFKAWTAFEKYATEWLRAHRFIEIHTPKISGLSSEGGSEVFYLKDYFGQKACLTQSPQLYKQMSIIAGLDRTYEIGEYFRANPSFTSRHHCEFTGLDLEIGYVESHEEIMDIEEELLRYTLTKMKEELGEEFLKLYGFEMPTMPKEKFPRITLAQAYEILKTEMHYDVPRVLKGDLDPEGERLISQWAKEKYGSEFLFVKDFPFAARAFYTMKHEKDKELGKCYDLFFRGVEITSGAQREHRYQILKEQIAENGIDPETMSEYLSFFKYGAPPHGGFGLGIGRVLTQIFKFANVKEVDFLFRGPSRLKP